MRCATRSDPSAPPDPTQSGYGTWYLVLYQVAYVYGTIAYQVQYVPVPVTIPTRYSKIR
jgi:hypothetical protein